MASLENFDIRAETEVVTEVQWGVGAAECWPKDVYVEM